MPRGKSAAAVAEEVQDTAAEQIEGQIDAIEEVSTVTFEQAPDDPDSQGPTEDYDPGVDVNYDDGPEKPEPAVSFKGTEYEGLSEKEVRSKVYSKSQTIIINKHRDEFAEANNSMLKPLGLVFGRKKTPKEKAADEIRAYLEKFPELRVEFPGLGPVAAVEGTPDDAVIR